MKGVTLEDWLHVAFPEAAPGVCTHTRRGRAWLLLQAAVPWEGHVSELEGTGVEAVT